MRDRIHEWKMNLKTTITIKILKIIDDLALKPKIGKNVASTTFNIVDRAIDFVNSAIKTNSFNIFGNYDSEIKDFVVPAYENMDITVNAINGSIFLKEVLIILST